VKGELVDELDSKILKKLMDGKHCKPYIKLISSELGVPEATIRSRIKRLVESGVIKGYYPNVDWDKAGYPLKARFFVKLIPKPRKSVDSFLNWISSNEKIIKAFEFSGEYEIQMDVLLKSKSEFSEFMMEIMEFDVVGEVKSGVFMRDLK